MQKPVERWSREIPTEWQVNSSRMNLALAETYLLLSNYKMPNQYLLQTEPAIFTAKSTANLISAKNQSLRSGWLPLRANLYNDV